MPHLKSGHDRILFKLQGIQNRKTDLFLTFHRPPIAHLPD